ncbi:MAG: polymer-forming cytoskeletal protein [Sedimenticolaceae bacterium]|nr:polymer-forming cytoskeletal protein [Sedimenticolaceae bacterium]
MKQKRHKHFKPSAFTTVIGNGTLVKGDIAFTQGLHLDGEVHGNVLGQGKDTTLTVSDKGHIKGDIKVANIIINGRIEGNIHAAQRVELAENAVVIGKVEYLLLEMAMGARVEGEMIRLGENREEKQGNS